MRIALTGATSPLGVRVRTAADQAARGGEAIEVQPLTADAVGTQLEGCDVLVHLGHEEAHDAVLPDDDAPVEVDGAGTVPDPRATASLLDQAAAAGIDRVVLLSSAMAYGAWPTNAVPLTEDAVLKPNPSLRFAVERAEEERLASAWRAAGGGARTVAVLRPTVQVAEDRATWLGRSLWNGGGVRPGDTEPSVQFVHLDDVASAVVLAARDGLDGAYNVAPDGWLTGEALRALASGPRLRVPDALATRLQALRWRLGLVSSPPGVVPYVSQPWVVANDRLRAAGWRPTWTNEEAFVASDRPSALATISPKRRQELALGVAGVVLVGGALAGGVAVRRVLRRRRRAARA